MLWRVQHLPIAQFKLLHRKSSKSPWRFKIQNLFPSLESMSIIFTRHNVVVMHLSHTKHTTHTVAVYLSHPQHTKHTVAVYLLHTKHSSCASCPDYLWEFRLEKEMCFDVPSKRASGGCQAPILGGDRGLGRSFPAVGPSKDKTVTKHLEIHFSVCHLWCTMCICKYWWTYRNN